MPARRRSGTRIARTPDSGYKFECQYCEDEVYQGAQPELVFKLEKERGVMVSQGFQCCIDCALDIKDENAAFRKKHKIVEQRQVRELRDATELDAAIPAELKKKAESSVDAKLDKVLDAITALTNLMAMQIQSQMPAVVAQPATIVEPPKPKRKILAPPPVKTRAKSVPAKPQKRNEAKAKAKPKPRRSR